MKLHCTAQEARARGHAVPKEVPASAMLYALPEAPVSDADGRVIVSYPSGTAHVWVWFAQNHDRVRP